MRRRERLHCVCWSLSITVELFERLDFRMCETWAAQNAMPGNLTIPAETSSPLPKTKTFRFHDRQLRNRSFRQLRLRRHLFSTFPSTLVSIKYVRAIFSSSSMVRGELMPSPHYTYIDSALSIIIVIRTVETARNSSSWSVAVDKLRERLLRSRLGATCSTLRTSTQISYNDPEYLVAMTDENMAHLPKSLLQGLEADLRALCADTKRRIPSAKETAERVILLLKEANSAETEAAAADGAGAAFCAACQPPESSSVASVSAASPKVVIRAVSCLHKLLTHRALSRERLPDVIDALERVGTSWSDDGTSLKVLQALLSLLTVRANFSGLSQSHLARSFSLLFKLKSHRFMSASAAVGPLSVIAGGVSRTETEDGVIEVTAKTAFRQVVPDLFSAANEILTSQDKGSHTSTRNIEDQERVAVAVTAVPSEDVLSSPVVCAAHCLFVDLCLLLTGSRPRWLQLEAENALTSFKLALAAEVLEEGIRSNPSMFHSTAIPQGADLSFLDVLKLHLVPAVLSKISSSSDHATLKAAFALLITLIRSLWDESAAAVESLLSSVLDVLDTSDGSTVTWPALLATDALHDLFYHGIDEIGSTAVVDGELMTSDKSTRRILRTPTFIAYGQKFGFKADSDDERVTHAVLGVTRLANRVIQGDNFNFQKLGFTPAHRLSRSPSISSEEMACGLVSSTFGLCIAFSSSVRWAAVSRTHSFARSVLQETFLAEFFLFLDSVATNGRASGVDIEIQVSPDTLCWPLEREFTVGFDVTEYALLAYADLFISAHELSADAARQAILDRIVQTARTSLTKLRSSAAEKDSQCDNCVMASYRMLFKVASIYGECFGNQWREFVDAIYVLDSMLYSGECITAEDFVAGASDRFDASKLSSATSSSLKTDMNDFFSCCHKLSWNSCNDLVSALVANSRGAIHTMSSGALGEILNAQGKTSASQKSSIRVFGITRGEEMFESLFGQMSAEKGSIPRGLWQLYAGHLVSTARGSDAFELRQTAVQALIRVVSNAIGKEESVLLSQEVAVCPLVDLLTSSHSDTWQQCLDAVHAILEARGEFVKDPGAWYCILNILGCATGTDVSPGSAFSSETQSVIKSRKPAKHEENLLVSGGNDKQHESQDQGRKTAMKTYIKASEATVLGGFRAVQLIADDFLPFLALETLSHWISVVKQFALQEQVLNVALTSIGLLWRTADFLAKSSSGSSGNNRHDALWMHLFEVLKAVGADERPEVRNGAVKTLTSTLMAHGARLSAEAWKGCIELALLPLLEEVLKGGVADLNTVSASAARPKLSPEVVLHYTRDTPRKQWNETRVLALNGVSSVLRVSMPRLSGLRDSKGQFLVGLLMEGKDDALWAKMLQAACAAASNQESEVANAGIFAMLELLKAAGSILSAETVLASNSRLSFHEDDQTRSGARLPFSDSAPEDVAVADQQSSEHQSVVSERAGPAHTILNAANLNNMKEGSVEMWEAVWTALDSAVLGTLRGDDSGIGSTEALVLLASGLGSVKRDLGDKFTSSSSVSFMNIMFGLATGLSQTDLENSDSQGCALSGGVSAAEVQQKVVAEIEAVSFGDDLSTWAAFISRIREILQHLAQRSRNQCETNLLMRLVALTESLFDGCRLHEEAVVSTIDSVLTDFGHLMHVLRADAMRTVASHNIEPYYKDIALNGTLASASAGPPSASVENGSKDPQRHDQHNYEQPQDAIWVLVSNAFVKILLRGLSCTSPLAGFWSAICSACDEILFGRDTDDPKQFHSASALSALGLSQAHDIRIAKCVRASLLHTNETADGIDVDLVEILVRGACESDQRSRPKFAWACQNCLFSLADCEWDGEESGNNSRTRISRLAARHVIKLSDNILQKYISDSERAGKCPLPASRRAEAVSVLVGLQELRIEDDDDEAQVRMRALHARLCECVEASDESIRKFAQSAIAEMSV